jgi:hypothetical protein
MTHSQHHALRYLKTTKASARTPWRHRTKHRAITHSQADKAALKEKRLLNKTSYANALSAAQDVLMEQAIKLRVEFGTHSVEYYFEAIMQHSRFQSKKKAPNRWNAFLCAEVKHITMVCPPNWIAHISECFRF